jgi:hypothetical protein
MSNDDRDLSPSERAGRAAGRSARRLAKAARGAQPEAERRARAAAEATRPLLDGTRRFVREHEDELKSAGAAGARLAASRAAPPILRPAVQVVTDDLASRTTRKREGAERAEDRRERPAIF